MSGPHNRALATQIGRGRTVRGTESRALAEAGKRRGAARQERVAIDSWYGRVDESPIPTGARTPSLQLRPLSYLADSPSSSPGGCLVVELCDGHGAGFAFDFFFVYHEQLISQSQVTRSCMRCCSDPFSLESEEDPWKGGGQPVEHNATTTVSGSHRRQVRPAASLIAYVQFQRCCA